MNQPGQAGLCFPAKASSGLLLLIGLVLASCSPGPPTHGTRLILAAVTNSSSSSSAPADLAASTPILKRRFDLAGLRPPFVEPSADGTFVLKFPRLSPEQLAEVRFAITNAGLLQFRAVHPRSGEAGGLDVIEPGYETMPMTVRRRLGSREEKQVVTFAVKQAPAHGLTGSYLKGVFLSREPVTDRPQIMFEFDAKGAELFARVTTDLSPRDSQFRQLAIVVDGRLYSAPRIMQPITQGRGVIQGDFDMKDARRLAAILENPLDVPLRIVDERDF